MHFRRLLSLLILGLTPVAAEAVDLGDAEFFEARVRPLLIEHCIDCHGPDKQKGGLRLDSRSGWATGGDSGPAAVPGKPGASLLIKAVHYTDRDLKMPPDEKLSAADVSVLEDWIQRGAPDPRATAPQAAGVAKTAHVIPPTVEGGRHFWSFQPIRTSGAPSVQDSKWPHNEADRHILSSLEAKGLHPAPDAAPAAIARRLYFDLCGLPPSPEEVATFEADTQHHGLRQAVEVLADRLIDSPAFAERWASHWLDITRFAESSGGGRSLPFKDAWRYRDYVLHSIRDDVPIDRIITEQLAGDLLPYETPAQRRRQLTATGFLALGPTNYEEQDKGTLRMDIVDEQLDTIGKSFLGMTIGCARCHDHKFDPIPTRDYYALAGIFRSTRTLKNYTDNVAHWVDTPLPMDGPEESKMKANEDKIAVLKKQIAELKDALKDSNTFQLRRRKKPIDPAELPGIIVDDTQAQQVGNWKHSTSFGPFLGSGYLHDLNEAKGDKTLSFAPKIPKTARYEVRIAFIGGPGRAERVPVTILHADGEELLAFKEADDDIRGLKFASIGTFRFEAGGQGFVQISNAGTEGYVTVDAVQFIPVGDDAPADGADKTVAQQEDPRAAELKQLEIALKKQQKESPSRPEVMSVADDEVPEDSPIHIRGSIRNLGDTVPRGFLQVAMKPGNAAPSLPVDSSGRLQFAQWVTSAENPLTARVMSNRIWHWIFGAGIVRTTENFGSTGEPPSHPALLDSLANRLITDGWSLKHAVRYLVTSHTYLQATENPNPKGLRIDPDNRLLWRMPLRRLDAESLRDALLLQGGSLDRRFGGQNLTADAVDPNDQSIQNLEYNHPFNDVRRAVYTPAFRNTRHPLFEAFDFADINQPIAQRTTSTVATQALFLMNHPFVIDQAKSAADRIMTTDKALPARIRAAWQLVLNRPPAPEETDIATEYIEAGLSGNATPDDQRDQWARLIQTLWSTPEFRFLK